MPVHRLIARPLLATARLARRRWLALALGTALVSVGCSSLETQQRRWIFRAQAAAAATEADLAEQARRVDMEGVWIAHRSAVAGRDIRLRGLWAEHDDDSAPVMLYLHGARWDLTMGTFRVDRMRDMGFSVLAIDYRGFGNSTDELPSEKGVLEDAQAAWRWLSERHPGRKIYVYGHSLGGAIAVQLAAGLADARQDAALGGVIAESTFTSIGELFRSFKWGWLPVEFLITERFDALDAIQRVRVPVLVAHGAEDGLVPSRLGKALYEKAKAPKRFVLVEGASHSSTAWRGAEQYRAALQELFGLDLPT
jgi:hypothetical protein